VTRIEVHDLKEKESITEENIFTPKEQEVTGRRKNYTLSIFIFCILNTLFVENEIRGAKKT
jgi:hypothetical protein